MNLKEIYNQLPKNLNNFDLISKEPPELVISKESFVDFYRDITQGYLEEVIATYDNRVHHYALRVKERGEDLHLHLTKMKLVYDHLGPFTATTEEEVAYELEDIQEAINDLLSLVASHRG